MKKKLFLSSTHGGCINESSIKFSCGYLEITTPKLLIKELLRAHDSFCTITTQSSSLYQNENEEVYMTILPNITDNTPEGKLKRVIRSLKKATDFDYEIEIISDKDINAHFDVNNEKIIITMGALKLPEEAIAFFLAHEIAHGKNMTIEQKSYVANLDNHRAAQEKIDKIKSRFLKFLLSTLAAGATIVVDRALTQKHELEADKLGVKIATEAGYDKEAYINLLNSSHHGGGLLDAHPSGQERKKAIS